MGVFEKMPYSNFHNLNLDWMIKKFKAMLEGFNNLTDHVNTFSNRINKNAADIREVENEQQKLYNRQSSLDTTIGRVERQQAERNATFETGIKSVNTRLTNSIDAQNIVNNELRSAIGQGGGGGLTMYAAVKTGDASFEMPITADQFVEELVTGKTFAISCPIEESQNAVLLPSAWTIVEGVGFIVILAASGEEIGQFYYSGNAITPVNA